MSKQKLPSNWPVIPWCIQYLERAGVMEPKLFVTPGSMSQMVQVQQGIDNNSQPSIWGTAAVLKALLESVCLIHPEIQRAMMVYSVLLDEQINTKVCVLAFALSNMPSEELHISRLLLKLLSKVAACRERSQLGPDELGSIFGPFLFSKIEDRENGNALVAFLIRNREELESYFLLQPPVPTANTSPSCLEDALETSLS